VSGSAYLPFARPLIDEAMVQAVADTLRSGWIASGPRVVDFEAALSSYHGGRPVRTVHLGHRGDGSRLPGVRDRRGR
jgi:dTDP-4-amino-4,6-dideoxygalactose transaminase